MSMRCDFFFQIAQVLLRDVVCSEVIELIQFFLICRSVLGTQLWCGIGVFQLSCDFAIGGSFIALSKGGFANVFICGVLGPYFRRAYNRLASRRLLRIHLIRLRIFHRVGSLRGILIVLGASNSRRDNGQRFLLAIGMHVRSIISINNGLGPQALRQSSAN